jgi:hypothetical protein
MTADLIATALDYAGRGWPVFPCEPGGKRPLGRLVPHGLKDASTDAAVIRQWWTAEPTANIGLCTGIAFDVLDIDGADALAALEAWSATAGPGGDVEGPTVQTPRGLHVYVATTGRGNTVNLGGLAGIDWRGRGGYVVAPGSRKGDGGAWEWITGTPQDQGPDTPIVSAPSWVLELFERRPAVMATGPPIRRTTGPAYGRAALTGELATLAGAVEGTRNHALNASAHSLGQLVGAGKLDAAEVVSELLNAARQIGLSDTESERTIESGLTAGIAKPRSAA